MNPVQRQLNFKTATSHTILFIYHGLIHGVILSFPATSYYRNIQFTLIDTTRIPTLYLTDECQLWETFFILHFTNILLLAGPLCFFYSLSLLFLIFVLYIIFCEYCFKCCSLTINALNWWRSQLVCRDSFLRLRYAYYSGIILPDCICFWILSRVIHVRVCGRLIVMRYLKKNW